MDLEFGVEKRMVSMGERTGGRIDERDTREYTR